MDEPKFIIEARAAVEAEAEGRPDANTYREAGHAALNEVYAQWLQMPLFNPHLLADEQLAKLRASYERRMQRQADRLANAKMDCEWLNKENQTLRDAHAVTDADTGLSVHEALTRARDQVRTLKHNLKSAEQAVKSGSPPTSKKVVDARHEQTKMENLRLATRVRELEQELATCRQPPSDEI